MFCKGIFEYKAEELLHAMAQSKLFMSIEKNDY